jgi:arsenite-transporting ATPase
MMLKYREVVGLGETAEELLLFARRTRGVRDLLADGTRSGIFVVTLDEPLVRGETIRLLGALAAHGVGILGLLWNRVAGIPEPLSMPVTIPQLVSAAVAPPPRGIDALQRWRDGWTLLSPITDG